MDKPHYPRLSKNLQWGALEIAVLYVLLGGLWILLSDKVAAALAPSQEALTTISLYKGWGYVLVTGLLLFWLIQTHTSAVRAGEAQLQQVIDALPVLISYVDAYGYYRFNNKTYEEWFGDTAQGKTLREVTGEEAYQTILQYVEKALAGEKVSYEKVLSYPSGERFVNATYIPDKAADGRVKGFFALVHDMTESKRTREQLRQWADAFNGCAHGIGIGDPQTNKLAVCNPAFASLHRSTVEELVGSGILSLYDPAEHEHIRQGMAEADRTGRIRYESRMIRRDGSSFPVQIDLVSVRDETGKLLYRVATVQDISERKQAEEENRSLARFPHENPNPVLRATQEGKIIYANPTSALLLKDWHCQVGDLLPPEWITRIEEMIDSEARKAWEIRCEDTIYSVMLAPIAGASYVNIYATDITERKHAEIALWESSIQFRTLFEASPDANLLIDPHGAWPILDCNTAACQMNGYTRDELIGKPIDILNPDPWDSARSEEYLANIRETGVVRYETLHRRKDGTRFPIEVSTSLISLGGRDVLLGIDRDITERKRAEENLRRFELLSEHSRDIILFMKRDNGQILEANAAAVRAYGYSHEELLGLTIWALRAPESQRLTDAQMTQADTRGILFETVHQRKDGTTFPVEVSSRGAAIGGMRTLISIARDITERKHAERALRESQVRLNFALEKSHTGGWDLDLGDHTALRTLEHDRIFGYETLLPMWTYEMFLDHVIPEDRSEVNRLFQEAVIAQTNWSFECRIRRTDGEVRWIWAVGGHLFDDMGHAYRMAGIVQDITERKQAEQEIQRLNEQLEQRVIERTAQLQAANKELEAFSYSVSHDLRAPLRAIDGYTRILVEDYEAKLDEEGKRICGVISAEARRMGQLIDDLLAFSRLGRKEIYSSKIDMKALAASVFEELIKREDRKRIDFQITRLPSASADPALIRQVWVNLLSNAIKFTSKKDHALIKVGSKQSSAECIYYVRDSGAGFDMEYVDKLFGVFQRLHGESEFEGTGVGLAIVQRIIRRHGGRVWAEGETDKGATFYFALPRQEEPHE